MRTAFCASGAESRRRPQSSDISTGESMNDVAERVVKIITAHMGIYADQVTPEASFLDDLGGDSLDVVELVMALEDEFTITIPDADVEHSPRCRTRFAMWKPQ